MQSFKYYKSFGFFHIFYVKTMVSDKTFNGKFEILVWNKDQKKTFSYQTSEILINNSFVKFKDIKNQIRWIPISNIQAVLENE